MTEKMLDTSELLLNINADIFKFVVQLYIFKNGKQLGSGTGFLIKKINRYFLCTNKHLLICDDNVLQGNEVLNFCDEIKIQLYLKENGIITLPLLVTTSSGNILSNVIIHPMNFIDIAAIEITSNIEKIISYLDCVFVNAECLSADIGVLIHAASKKEGVFVIGYPHGKQFNDKNYPFASEVFVKSINGSPFNYPEGITPEEKADVDSCFISVAGESYQGMSGAPVIMMFDNMHIDSACDFLIIGVCAIFDANNIAHAYKLSLLMQIIDSHLKNN